MSQISRRTVLTLGVASLATPAIISQAISAGRGRKIVLVHGAWHGAWAWNDVIPLLGQMGFQVSALDLSGLGANFHRQSFDIGLHVHSQDLLNHLFFNDIDDATVVAHSYGGGVLSQALVGDTDGRIGHAIYLDAFRLGQGESVAGVQGAKILDGMKRSLDDGKMIPPRPKETWEKIWGMTGAAADFAESRVRPMSPNCFLETVQGDPFSGNRRHTYIRCSQNDNEFFKGFLKMSVSDPRFKTAEVDGHHNIMVIDPPRMADAIAAAV